MRIGIDATVLAQPHIVGIGRFIHSLLSAFAAGDADHEFTLFYRLRNFKRPRLLWKPRDPRFRIGLLSDLLDRFTLPKLDLFHATYQRLPDFEGRTPYLATLHDIYYATRPEMSHPEACRRWVARYRDIARRSRMIMTVSEYSKREIVDFLAVEPERVRVVLEAAAATFSPRPADEVAAARQRYSLPGPYVLFAGGFDPRKNLPAALRAFALALPRLPADVCLAVSGGGGEIEAEARRLPATLGLGERVRFLGFVPDADFPALMSGCEVFFFPSLFEGFGLPALEAMACGAAVVTSSTTSLPEVCGDAALLVDPANPEAMANALALAVTDRDVRARARRDGMARAKLFDWQRTAAQTLELYRETAAANPVAAVGSPRARDAAALSPSR